MSPERSVTYVSGTDNLRLVGAIGFEPPTPWSRTRFHELLKLVEFCGFQVIAVEPVAVWLLKAIELY
jgi:hypothetical protein